MNFTLNDDQKAMADAIEKLVRKAAADHACQPRRFEFSAALQAQLARDGFFSAVLIDELGPVAAAGMVMELCKLPLCLEMAASAFVAPYACPDAAGPFAVAVGALDQPLRFAPVAATLIHIQPDAVAWASLRPPDVAEAESLFAYPMGTLRAPASLQWHCVPSADIGQLHRHWRIGVAAEIVGCLSAALASVIEHVSDRRQFGHPLGAFQAVQHRLAQCAGSIESARWLVLRAAGTGSDQDALMALGFAQDMVARVTYDLHQFMGAMGLTLEHPLHRWTYRAKLLRSDSDGAAAQFVRLADQAWAGTPLLSL
ncbi:acyl-CoA dehydrogenase [Bordetella petrii]|nr:acyl-CoA dehydrogenase [Bordetella petrii]